MDIKEARQLINSPVLHIGSIAHWADLGCGTGMFTTALAGILPKGSIINAVDNNIQSLRLVPTEFEGVTVEILYADFIKDDLPLKNLDGIIMANALHFVKDKLSLLQKVKRYLKPVHELVIVEYETDTANTWVPYPVGFQSLKLLLAEAGYKETVKTGTMASRYQSGGIYAALIR